MKILIKIALLLGKIVLFTLLILILIVAGFWLYIKLGPYDSAKNKAIAPPSQITASHVDTVAFRQSQGAEYFFIAKAYADFIISHGRDRYGREHSPLFATTMDRATGNVYRKNPPKAPKGIRIQDRTWRGANPANHGGLYTLLYKLSKLTGDLYYADEANKAIDWFFAHCQSPKTGLMAWGEHMGWDFFKEKPITWNFQFFIHEYKDYSYWDRVWKVNPDAAENFARGLWDNQIYAKTGQHAGEFSRHANYYWRWPSRGRAFPNHGGKYIKVWARAFKETGNKEFLRAITTLLDYYDRQTSPISGAIIYATDYPEQYSLAHNMGLAIRLYEAMVDVPSDLAARMKKMADQTDSLYLSFAHDPAPGGKGFIKYANVHTLEPGETRQVHKKENKIPYAEMWGSGYSASKNTSSANSCYHRYEQTAIKDYLDLFLQSAEAYLFSEPPQSRVIYPNNYSGAISMMRRAYKELGDLLYLDRAKQLIYLSLHKLMDDKSPLPKASNKSDYYEAITGADGLMNNVLSLWMDLNDFDEQYKRLKDQKSQINLTK